MNYCNGMEENTASTLCNPCPYEYNCTKCKEEMDKLARKSHKKKKKHNKDDDIKIEVSPLTEEDLENDEELVNRLKKYGYLR